MKSKKLNRDQVTLLIMTLIPLGILVVFTYGPIWGWVYAFFDYRIGMPLRECEFVGLKYFRIAFTDPDIARVLINTLAMSFMTLLMVPIAALFAILLNELRSNKAKKFIQVATTLPNFMSWVIVFSVFFIFFSPGSGVINTTLTKWGWITTPIDPLEDLDATWFFQTGVRFWKELGYNAIIFFASIASIDAELYEAAKVDGADRFQLIWNITVPGLAPTVLVLLLINVGFILSNGFEQYYVFYNGLVAPKLEVLDYYVYKLGMAKNDIPYATAVSVTKTFISVFLVYITNALSKKNQWSVSAVKPEENENDKRAYTSRPEGLGSSDHTGSHILYIHGTLHLSILLCFRLFAQRCQSGGSRRLSSLAAAFYDL